ncbi:MAG: nucleotidyltransferase domain-containing protein [Nitrososphaerota archaeon]
MSKLRILEEARRKSKILKEAEKINVLNAIKNILIHKDEIILAIIHGGFVNSKVFRDIDIAVYVENVDDKYICADELKYELEKVIDIGIDVQIMNSIPPSFMLNILKRGIVLFERRKGFKAIMKLHVLEEVRRIKMHKKNFI